MNAKNTVAKGAPAGGGIAVNPSRQDLDEVVDFDALVAAANEALGAENVVAISSNYVVLNGKDKERLIGVPFLIRKATPSADKLTGQPYMVLHVVTKDNEQYVVTDGSSGIYQQVTDLIDKHGRDYAFLVANGLRSSTYGVTANGTAVPLGSPEQVSSATTFYLA